MISSVLLLIICALITRVIWGIVYNLYIYRLRKFSGPKLAAAPRLYEKVFEILKKPYGQYINEIERLHKVYGV